VSPQCASVLTALRGGGMVGMTTMDLFRATGLCDPTRRIRELRSKGYAIELSERRSMKGARIVTYRLLEPKEA